MATQEQLMIPGAGSLLSRATPMDLLQVAMSQNADIDKLTKLWELQKDWEATESRKAYDEAIAAFKRNPPTITKNKKVSFGSGQNATGYKHATLDHVVEQITPALSAVGISHRWEVTQNDDFINVSCVLTHTLGHNEKTTLRAKADTSGSKNAIQAIGSAVTYLQRYTLLAACGLAATDDTDGEPEGMAEETAQEWLDAITGAPNHETLKRTFQQAYNAAVDAGDKQAESVFVKAKNKRYRELQA